MWLSSRRNLLLMLVLTGCGFRPALGTDGAAQKLMGRIWPADPKDQYGFDFVKQIKARLGRVEARDYDLTYDFAISTDGVALTSDGATTRYNMIGTVTWTLTRHRDGLRMAGGSVDSFASYSATGSTVAGVFAREDAGRRLMTLLADQVVARILAASTSFPA
jgi:LPS-assembly lipoprotein